MKKQFIYIVFFFFPIVLLGQADYLPQKEVGFNIGYLVTNVLRNETSASTLGSRNFMLSFKKHYLNNAYIRYGLSFNFGKVNDDGNDPEKFFQTNFRIGYEYKYRFNKRWNVNRGCDFMINYFTSDFNFGSDKTKVISAGGAPFLGIQYNINPRVSLSTETGIHFFYVKQENAFEFNSGFLSEFNGSGVDFRLFGPQELILSVAF